MLRFRRPVRGGWLTAARETGPILWAAPLFAFVVVFLGVGADFGRNLSHAASPIAPFGQCGAFSGRDACVVDGDTFWYRGTKIRIADINTPEISSPKCAFEAQLGARATTRLIQLLNEGEFALEPIDRSRDRYGRALYVVTRDGSSLGTRMVSEGLAERWNGFRREWC